MLGLIFLIPASVAFGLGFLLSIVALFFLGRIGPRRVRSDLTCFLMIVLGVSVWLVLVSSIPIGNLLANYEEAFPALLRSSFLVGLTPIAALPALLLYGPGKK